MNGLFLRDLLEKVRKIEESDGKLNLPVRLLPLDDGSGSVVDLLRREIENLQVDKDRLQAQLTEAENQVRRSLTFFDEVKQMKFYDYCIDWFTYCRLAMEQKPVVRR